MNRTTPTAAIVIVCAIAVLVPTVAGAALSLSISGGAVGPGETITIEPAVEGANFLAIDGVPEDWTIHPEGGVEHTVVDDRVEWFKPGENVSVAFDVPDDASGNVTLSATAWVDNSTFTEQTVTITVEEDAPSTLVDVDPVSIPDDDPTETNGDSTVATPEGGATPAETTSDDTTTDTTSTPARTTNVDTTNPTTSAGGPGMTGPMAVIAGFLGTVVNRKRS